MWKRWHPQGQAGHRPAPPTPGGCIVRPIISRVFHVRFDFKETTASGRGCVRSFPVVYCQFIFYMILLTLFEEPTSLNWQHKVCREMVLLDDTWWGHRVYSAAWTQSAVSAANDVTHDMTSSRSQNAHRHWRFVQAVNSNSLYHMWSIHLQVTPTNKSLPKFFLWASFTDQSKKKRFSTFAFCSLQLVGVCIKLFFSSHLTFCTIYERKSYWYVF